jgi:hypothetical protein
VVPAPLQELPLPEHVDPEVQLSLPPVHVVPAPLQELPLPEHVDPAVQLSLPPVHVVPAPLQELPLPEHVDPPEHVELGAVQICPLIVQSVWLVQVSRNGPHVIDIVSAMNRLTGAPEATVCAVVRERVSV